MLLCVDFWQYFWINNFLKIWNSSRCMHVKTSFNQRYLSVTEYVLTLYALPQKRKSKNLFFFKVCPKNFFAAFCMLFQNITKQIINIVVFTIQRLVSKYSVTALWLWTNSFSNNVCFLKNASQTSNVRCLYHPRKSPVCLPRTTLL